MDFKNGTHFLIENFVEFCRKICPRVLSARVLKKFGFSRKSVNSEQKRLHFEYFINV